MDHREHDLPAGDQVDLASLLFGTGLMSAMSLRDHLLRALDAEAEWLFESDEVEQVWWVSGPCMTALA
jgi:hypothetical protein